MKTFIESLIKSINVPENLEISTHEVIKETGKKLGVTVRQNGSMVAPTVYVDDIYEKYRQGLYTVSDARDAFIERIAKAVAALSTEPPVDDEILKQLTHWNVVAPRITLCAASKNTSSDFKESVPFVPLANLAIYFRVMVSNEGDKVASFVVTQQHLQMWGKTVDDLLKQGQENSLNDISVMDIGKDLLGITAGPTMLAISNKRKTHGAGMLASPKVLDEICHRIGNVKLLIIPSSIHEIIVLSPDKEMGSAKQLATMIKMVNNSDVVPAEQLSDVPYIYDMNTKTVSVYNEE